MKKTITCIICPRGCCVTVDTVTSAVSGNFCKRGAEYAVTECKNPTRTVTSTVRVNNRTDKRICVKTKLPVPKSAIYGIMETIHKASVSAPVKIGDIIIPDTFGTEIVAASDIE